MSGKKKFGDTAKLLRIYTVEKDHVDGVPLYEWLIQKAAMCGLGGATVFRGIGGYCIGNPVLSPEFNTFHINIPLVVEIIETQDAIEAYLKEIEKIVPRGLVTIQDVQIRYYGSMTE